MADFVNITYSMFFDRQPVKDAVDKATRSRLSKAGAFVRTTARDSIRKRKAVSEPGAPPSSHEGSLRRLILFAFEKTTESVVVGPKLFKQQNPTGPNLLEFGGSFLRRDRNRSRTLRYRPRPFMGPALEKEAPKFPDLFKNSVRG